MGSCSVKKIRDFIRFTQTYRDTHRYNVIGVGISKGVGDEFESKIEPDTCINFVDHAIEFLKDGINIESLSQAKEADYYFVVESEDEFK